MAWSKSRPCAESSTTLRSGPALVPDGFHGLENRLGLEHHALAAAERTVVHGPVAVGSPVAQVVDADLDDAGVLGALHHAMRERPLEELGKDRQHMEDHGPFRSFKPSGKSTDDAPGRPDRFPRRWNARRALNKPPSTANRPAPPESSQPSTRPRLSPVRRSTTWQPTNSD